jgi:hypothetical protein
MPRPRRVLDEHVVVGRRGLLDLGDVLLEVVALVERLVVVVRLEKPELRDDLVANRA